MHHIRKECPFLKFKGIMSMGEIGNVSEFKKMNELRNEMLKVSDVSEEQFIVSMGTS